ncbi:MAG: glycerophosphodiester phosphodiesterase, partial [Rhizobiales bacterium]|nr:glycerophosphodiester phosphodiesterase [Hyphomicrobiales bacterium]
MKASKLIFACGISIATITTAFAANVELGPRPNYLINQMADSELKEKLLSCAAMSFVKTDFSIGHRGAAMQFPEHTKQSYI